MDPRIKKLKSTTFYGRRFKRAELSEIQQMVQNFPALSRHELAQTVCENLRWKTPKGANRFNAALRLLDTLEKFGVIELPDKVVHQSHASKPLAWTLASAAQADIQCDLHQLLPIRLEVVSDQSDIEVWNELVDRYHYLGYRRPMGPHLRYFIIDSQGRRLGCVMFSYATKRLPCRDAWIGAGWVEKQHKRHLNLILNNNRFLVLPWVKVKNLASKVLSMASRQLPADWYQAHGWRPVLLETFVDTERYDASCYRAANWQLIGHTEGRGKTRKEVLIYPLIDAVKTVLVKGPGAAPKKSRRRAPKRLHTDDPFVQLWHNLIDIVVQVAEQYDRQWQQRRRVLNSLLIMLFIFRLVFSTNRQGYQITLVELWAQCRVLNIALPQQQPVAASAMCQARRKLDENIFKTLQARLLASIELDDAAAKWHGHRVHAVDGTKINLPRALVKADYRCPSENAWYPQAQVSCLYQLKMQLPVDYDLSASTDERQLALAHLQALRPHDVVVYDRGYYSYEMLYQHQVRGVYPVFRIKQGAAGVFDRFIATGQRDGTVKLVPTKAQCDQVRKRDPNARCQPITVRLVRYHEGGTTYTLATTLVDRQRYTITALADLYHGRWGIEELYKISKNLLSVEDFHANTERGVKQELYAHFVLITLTRLCTNHTEMQCNHEPHDDPRMFKSNFKNALSVMASNLESLVLKHVSIVSETLNQIIRCIGLCQQRKRPHRSYARCSRKPIGKWKPGKPAKTTSS